MGRYGKLLKNTLIFALGSFGSKMLQFILLPYYTRALTSSEYGTLEIITQTINIAVPLICLCIYDGVLRFAMDKSIDHKTTLATAFKFTIISLALVALLAMVADQFVEIENIWLILMILIVQSLRTLFSQYARAVGFVKQFSISGVVQTVALAIANIVFLSVYRLGIAGYLLGIILADLLSLIILLFMTRIARAAFEGVFDRSLLKAMLKYSAPLVPNAVMWWGMNASNRYFIVHYHGLAENGLFGVASKIPALLTMLMTIFTQAWQLSAIEEYDASDKAAYYTNIYAMLESFLFICGVGLVIFIRLFWFSIGEGYQEAIMFVPPVLASVIFSSLASFFGSLYLAAKRTKSILVTTIVGAVIGIALNALLIPGSSGVGAGLATLISFVFVSAYRAFDLRNFIEIRFDFGRLLLNMLVLAFSFGVIYFSNTTFVVLSGVSSSFAVLAVNRQNISKITSRFKALKRN